MCQEDLHQFDNAIKDYDAVIKATPGYADGYELRGKAYLKSGKAKAAVADFTRLIQLNPKYAGGYLARAQATETVEGPKSKSAAADRAMAHRLEH